MRRSFHHTKNHNRVKSLLYPAALVVAVSFSAFAKPSLPYGADQKCSVYDDMTRLCLAGDSRFIEIGQPDWELVTGSINGELATCITWGLSSVREGNASSFDVEQTCVWHLDRLPDHLPQLQRSRVL